MNLCTKLGFNLLGLITLATLMSPPQAFGQLSKLTRIHRAQPIRQAGYQEHNFSQANAVGWDKPTDLTGISTIQTHRATVTLSLDSNFANGTLSGGNIIFPSGVNTSTGLTSVKVPTIGSSGLITNPAGAGFTATNAGAGWRYNASLNQADKPNTATGIGILGAGEFSSQNGGSSNFDNAFITITGGNMTASPGVGTGTKVSMQIYSETTNGTVNKKTEYTEAGDVVNTFTGVQYLNQADSSNSQAKFDALSGSGNAARSSTYDAQENIGQAGAVTSGGFDTAGGTLGNAFTVTDADPANPPAPALPSYIITTKREGEDAVVLNVTSVASNGPGYADQVTTAGGNDSDPIVFTNPNNIATGATGNAANTEMTTCIAAAYECGGGVAVGSTRATFIKTFSTGSFSAFGPNFP